MRTILPEEAGPRRALLAIHADVKPPVVGHWGTTSGQNFFYVYLNRSGARASHNAFAGIADNREASFMSEYFAAVVFIDRREAKMFHFSAQDDVKLVLAHTSAQRQHHQANHEDGTKHAVDGEFMQRIVDSLGHDGNTLICGPGNSKYELQAYMQQHTPELAARISGVEDLAEPRDSGILAAARQFFRTRGHRYGAQPKPSARHFDVPFKS